MTFEEAAARWVMQHFRGIDPKPLLGTVEFEVDWFACDSGPNYCDIDVKWQEEHVVPGPIRRFGSERIVETRKKIVDYRRTLDKEYFDIKLLIREITETALQGLTQPSAPEDPSAGV